MKVKPACLSVTSVCSVLRHAWLGVLDWLRHCSCNDAGDWDRCDECRWLHLAGRRHLMLTRAEATKPRDSQSASHITVDDTGPCTQVPCGPHTHTHTHTHTHNEARTAWPGSPAGCVNWFDKDRQSLSRWCGTVDSLEQSHWWTLASSAARAANGHNPCTHNHPLTRPPDISPPGNCLPWVFSPGGVMWCHTL